MRRFAFSLVSAIALTLSATIGMAVETSPWVDAVNGNDANQGTFASPLKTIKQALLNVGANGTIHVKPGTYNVALGETFPITIPSGIKLQSTSGAASTIIDATGANKRVLYCNANSNTTLVEGFTIKGGFYQPPVDGSNATGGGIFMDNNDQTTISRCIITGNEARGYNGDGGGFFSGGIAYGGGIAINNGTHTIINCVISNNIARGGSGSAPATIGYPGGDAHGGGIWDGAGTATLTNNTFYGNQAIGGNGANAISGMNSAGGAGGAALYSAADTQNATAKNNIFANNTDTGGTGGTGFGGGFNGANGNAFGALNATSADYNLFYSNTGGDGTTGTNAITGQNPLFVNPPGDLHLRSSSPAGGAGTNVCFENCVDLDGNPRPYTPTIGAYEVGNFLTVTGGIGRVTVTWPGVGGASSYNLYYCTGCGTVSTSDTKVTGATSPFVLYPVLNSSSWTFALTAVENGVEGPLGPQSTTASAPVCGGPDGPWGTSASSGNSFTNLTRDLSNANILYATATDSYGLYKSTDAGNAFSPLTGPFNGTAMRAVAANGSTVLVAGAGNIYRSTDGGSTWSTVVSGAGIGETLEAIAIDPLNTSTAYAGDFHIDFGTTSSYLVAKSTDGGATWHNFTDASAADLRGYKLLIDSATSGTLYAGGSGNPFLGKSTNNGGTWSNITPSGNGYPQSMALAPSSTSTLYFGLRDNANNSSTGVWKSTNGGTSWNQMNNGFTGPPDINALIVDSADATHVFAGTSSGFRYTTDGASNWNPGASGQGSGSINAFAQTTTRRLVATTGVDRIIILPLNPAPTISANASPASGNPAGGDSVTISGTGFNPVTGLRVLFGGVDGTVTLGSSNSTSISVTTPAHAPGAVDVAVINPDGQAAIRTNGFTYAAGTIALTATASSGQVALSWTAAGGATSYTIRRSTGSGYTTLTSVSGTSSNDSAVSNGVGYLYEILANTGAYSNVDLAVPMAYTDPSLTTGNLIRAAHFTELRTAVNAARTAVGLGAITFTDPSLTGALVKRIHLIELRSGIDAARAAIGLTALTYIDPTITAGVTPIRASHITQLRAGLQ